MNYDGINAQAEKCYLEIFGAFYSDGCDSCPQGSKTMLMLGPKEPGFWPHVRTQPEFRDGGGHPLDRWSKRTIDNLAEMAGGSALFPFGGPPYQPFFTWALLTGRCWESPVLFLVHDRSGLFVSYRGAISLPRRIDLPSPPERSPCEDCAEKPCLSACPVGAMGSSEFDAEKCKGHIRSDRGRPCLDTGCEVRRSCPAGRGYARSPEQSRFHQLAFLAR
ncbi:MAG: ferredoxin [Albidovulum sp.]|nr:ferredoxin [Albidovulum sp.]MDE0304767.1 ferredoxin [Albidovulum sp.]MDE0534552.1 ferredoxin [Albidovulum sp.]